MKKILFALTSHDRIGNTVRPTGFYLPEAAHPWAVLHAAGFDIDFISPKGGRPPMYGADSADEVSRRFLNNQEILSKIENTTPTTKVDPSNYAAILFVGGHGTMWDFPDDQSLAQVGASIYEAGGVIGAVCHGPAALVNLKLSDGQYLVNGKQVAAFTDDEERAMNLHDVVPFLLATTLRQRGAIHIAGPNWESKVIVDERLVTGQNPASAASVGQEMARLLKHTATSG